MFSQTAVFNKNGLSGMLWKSS